MGTITLKLGDICREETEAIVNAANTDLLHGGGLAARIVAAGGKKIQEQSDSLAPIPLGEAAVTEAGRLKAKFVIHAASMKLGGLTDKVSLANAVRNSLKRARELNLSSIAFPAIGAGAGGWPVRQCAEISLQAANDFLKKNPDFKEIIFVLHHQADLKVFQEVYAKIIKN